MIYLILAFESAALISFGYIYSCCYLQNKKPSEARGSLNLSRGRVIYLTLAVLTSVILIFMLAKYHSLRIVDSARLMCLVHLLFPIAAIDLKMQKIPNKLILILLILRLVIFGVEAATNSCRIVYLLKDYIIGALSVGGFFLIMLVVFRNSVGMGDVKLFTVIGLYQGLWGAINSVCFSLAVSFVIAVALLATKSKDKKDVMSFGPPILAGTVIAICLSGM